MATATTNPVRLALAGLAEARRRPQLALVLWAAHLALAGALIAPFAAGLAEITGDRPAAAQLLGRPSLDLFVQVRRAGGELFATFGPALFAGAALALLANALLAGGVLEVLLASDDRPFFHRFGRGAGRFAGRMLRLGAIAAPIVLGGFFVVALPFVAGARSLAEGGREIPAVLLRSGGLALAALVALAVLLALDLARVRLVRDDRRDTFRALRQSLGSVLRHPVRVVGAWLVLAVALATLTALYWLLARWIPTTATAGILSLALAQQLLVISRAGLRVALWTAEIEIVRGLAPSPSSPEVEATPAVEATPPPAPELEAVHPVLRSTDIERSIAFFAGLGFQTLFRDDLEATRYAAVGRDDIELHLQWHDPADLPQEGDLPTYRILVADVDALYADFSGSGALAAEGAGPESPWARPGDTPWGTREFHLRDPDGNGLQFYRPR